MIRYVLIFSLWALPSSLQGQYFPTITFQKFYDNTGEDEAQCIIRAQDDNLLIGGNSMIESAEGLDCANVWILKVDTLGERIWQQEITVRGCEELRDMILTEDGGVLFTGVTNGMIQHSEKGSVDYWGDVIVGKVSPYGRLEWVKTFGGSRLDQAFGITQGALDEYLIVGGTHSHDGALQKNAGMSDVWTLKLDPQGNVRLSETVGGTKSDWAQAVTRCANGDFLIAGFTNSSDLGEEKLSSYGNGLLIRMRDGGYLEWSRTFACPRGGHFTDIREASDGRIVLSGTYDDPSSGRDFWWLRLTAQGRLINQKTLPQSGEQWLEAVDICPDNGFIFGGYSRHQKTRGQYGKGGDDFWILRTDKKGDIIWMDTYGGPDDERCRDVLAYRPGVFYALGDKYNHFERGSNSRDFWLIRLEELPRDSIQADIFVRAPDYRIDRNTPTRFRARCQYGDRFLWDFGDGTTSTEKNPLKSYRLPGMYEVSLTVFVNESCQETIMLEEVLEVW